MLGKQEKIVSLVTIDARFGNYKGSAFAGKNEYINEYKPYSKERILQLIGKEIFNEKKGTVKVFPEVVHVSPVLVWMPCMASLSPLYPFQLVFIGETRIYIRFDGKVFTKLKTGKGL